MSITLKLDSTALSSLIDADPSFKLELQSAVLANIAGRYIKGAGEAIEQTLARSAENAKKEALESFTKLVKEDGGYYARNRRVLGDATSKDLAEFIKKDLQERLPTIFDSVIASSEMQCHINQFIERRLRDATELMIRKELDKRFAAASAAMGRA